MAGNKNPPKEIIIKHIDPETGLKVTSEISHPLADVLLKEIEQAKPQTKDKPNVFYRYGDNWIICYRGKQSFSVHHVDGLTYCAILLKKPNKAFRVDKMREEVKGI